MDWRKIESLDVLPRDGKCVIAEPQLDGTWVYDIAFFDVEFGTLESVSYSVINPTHWCPITPPEADT